MSKKPNKDLVIPSYSKIILKAIERIKNEILLYGIVVITLLISVAVFDIDALREVTWAIIVIATIVLIVYFLVTMIKENKKLKKYLSSKEEQKVGDSPGGVRQKVEAERDSYAVGRDFVGGNKNIKIINFGRDFFNGVTQRADEIKDSKYGNEIINEIKQMERDMNKGEVENVLRRIETLEAMCKESGVAPRARGDYSVEEEKLVNEEEVIELLNSMHISLETAITKFEGRQGCHAHIYTHDKELTLKDAIRLKGILESAGIASQILTHRDPNPPDAIFIGALVGAEEARIALSAIPYEIKYIFRPDYPEEEGGDYSGLLLGIGYMSTHYQDLRGDKSIPVEVSKSQIKYLRESGLSNAEFQQRLREITSF